MADPKFFATDGPFTLAQLAEIAEATIAPGGDPGRSFKDVSSLEAAGPDEIGFLDNKKYVDAFTASRAGGCIVHPDLASRAPAGMALLLSTTPYLAYARVARAFHPEPAIRPGIHPMAWVDPTARLGSDVEVAAGAFIGARAQIGARCRIGPNAVIGDAVVLGEDTIVGPNASLSHCEIGARVRVYPGARIGQDGFGFAAGEKGLVKVPQLGRVIVGDGCEIGANSCIDRGSASDTIIGPGTVIDNLVQIGHNVKVGRNCILVAQVGISGSTRLGDGVIIGGQAGLVGHLRIGSGAQIAAQSGVMRDIAPGEVVGGSPAMPIGEWRRQSATLRRLVRRKGD